MKNKAKTIMGFSAILVLLIIIGFGSLVVYFVSINRDSVINFASEYGRKKQTAKVDNFNNFVEQGENNARTITIGNKLTTYDRSGEYPNDFPHTIAKYPGAVVESFNLTTDKDAASRIPRQTIVMFHAPVSQKSIIDFYTAELKKSGWTIIRNELDHNGHWVLDGSTDIDGNYNSHRVGLSIQNSQDIYTEFSISYYDHVYVHL